VAFFYVPLRASASLGTLTQFEQSENYDL